jgi:hypothetical protein
MANGLPARLGLNSHRFCEINAVQHGGRPVRDGGDEIGEGAMRHDVFVSYSHIDDESTIRGKPGVVTTFVDQLRMQVLKKMTRRRKIDFWMDHLLASNKRIVETLNDHVSASDLLLLFMSPTYLSSEWCHSEMERFLEANRAAFNRENIFIVAVDKTDRRRWPALLQALDPIQLYEEDFGGRTTPFGWPYLPDDSRSPYWQALNTLAHDISTHLNEQDSPPPKVEVQPSVGTDSRRAAEAGDVGASLSAVSFDAVAFESEWQRLRRPSLRQFDFVDLLGNSLGSRAHVGMPCRLRIEVSKPAFLTVLMRGSSGRWQLAFPLGEGDERLLKSGVAYDFPSESMAPLASEFDKLSPGDVGTEIALAIASPWPLPEVQNMANAEADFRALLDSDVTRLLSAVRNIPDAELRVCRLDVA